ncbi:MAG: extracellular matrix regulator RemB [Desulfotomaculales bacterium]
MFVHLGKDVVVFKDEIVVILDYRANFKEPAQEEDVQNLAGKGKEKSWVVTTKEIFISPISSSTLKKRAESFY